MVWMFLLGVVLAGETEAQVGEVLDGFHRAAATADFDAYFGAMTEDAVFVGTDATERWARSEFEAYARPHFQGDSAWTYTSRARHVVVRGEVAWFDEDLDHARYGQVRGSGVLVRVADQWKIAQYVLSFPIPNEIAPQVVEQIKSQ